MNELQNRPESNAAGTEPSGIFEPKPIDTENVPLSGPQKAIRLTIILAVLVLIGIICLLLRNPFMKPVKSFYRGLSHGDVISMTQAFPKWLTEAKVSEDTVTTADMCSAVLSAAELDYGKGFKAKVSLSSKTEVGRDYLDKIESGIKAQYHTDVSISKGYWVRLCVLYRSSGSEQEVTRFARIYKIDGKWYLLDVPSETQ